MGVMNAEWQHRKCDTRISREDRIGKLSDLAKGLTGGAKIARSMTRVLDFIFLTLRVKQLYDIKS
jgi:hypothetical protein